MYNKRIKIFVILGACLLLLCLLRLAEMQLLSDSFYRDKIAKLKLQQGLSRQLRTVRGKILDRKDKVLAVDEPRFQLCINYNLTSCFDERVRQANSLRAATQNTQYPIPNTQYESEDLLQIIDKCTYFGLEHADIENKIKILNNRVWNLRTFVAWARNGPNPDILEKYGNINSVPLSVAIADFEKKFPKDKRLLLTAQVDDIAEMHDTEPLLQLKTNDDIRIAQLEFMDTNGVEILAKARRFYLFGSVAAQTIGWVGRPQQHDEEPFENDRLSMYLDDEVCGREGGVEYVCETLLRGRRGEEIYDIDQELVNRTETQPGKDVQLTLDIELQQKIENYLADYNHDPNCGPGMAAVVIDVPTGDILALVSMPTFDLNRIRYNYTDVATDPNKPLINRAINKQYPPGSAVKPLILIAALESGKIAPDEIISCPAQPAPEGWPNCWIYNKYPWMGHDDNWPNNARNAIKGSCNIYFSRLASRIEPENLQQWLFKFGYGQEILSPPPTFSSDIPDRNFRQASGIISSSASSKTITKFEQIPPLAKSERKHFGIGQGNLRVTPLQVANAFAAIARGGVYKPPRLFREIQNFRDVVLDISAETLKVVYDGMGAVVNEPRGTAHEEFAPVLTRFAEQGVKVYGKTGSTERPDNAWFAGFTQDSKGRSISIAVVVEGGQRGSSDAAPLARDIIQFCIEAGYIGQTLN